MSEDPKGLTTRQGHPVFDNQNTRTIGDRGPATLENYHFMEKLDSQKPDPVTFERQVANCVFDFVSQSPEPAPERAGRFDRSTITA